jgi:hypothetical protein
MQNKPKYYRVLKDLPTLDAEAILKSDSDGNYIPIEDFWCTDAVKDGDINMSYLAGYAVEHAPDWFERVYEMSAFGKMVYVTKDEAIKQASRFFKTK